MSSKILNITKIKLEIEKTNPPKLNIYANGEVSTSGWDNGRLIPYVYITPPVDGIYEFDFIANAPKEIVPRVITPITAETFTWDNFPKELSGVKIYASLNFKIEKLSIK